MLAQIPITAVMDTGQFFKTKTRIIKFNIPRFFCVVRKFVFGMFAKAKIVFFYSIIQIPSHSYFFPFLKSFFSVFRIDKILLFHLFKLPRSESEIARRDFISKRFSDLRDAKRQFFSGRLHYVQKIQIDSLTSFRTQINFTSFPFYHAHLSLKHQIKFSDISKLSPAIRANRLNWLIRPEIRLYPFALQQVIRAPAFLAFFTIHQRVGKTGQMSAGFPSGRVH